MTTCRWCEGQVYESPLMTMWVHTNTRLLRCVNPIDPFTGEPLPGVWLAEAADDSDLCGCGDCDFCDED